MKINLLKGRMAERNYTSITVAAQLNRTPDYVRKRVRNPANFKLSEVYTVCDILEIPIEDIPKYFPKER